MKKKITVIIATHKKYRVPNDKLYLPIHVGAYNKDDIGFTKDSTKDNIIQKPNKFNIVNRINNNKLEDTKKNNTESVHNVVYNIINVDNVVLPPLFLSVPPKIFFWVYFDVVLPPLKFGRSLCTRRGGGRTQSTTVF